MEERKGGTGVKGGGRGREREGELEGRGGSSGEEKRKEEKEGRNKRREERIGRGEGTVSGEEARRVRGVVFDLDGVIIDSEVHLKSVLREFFRRIAPSYSMSGGFIGSSSQDVLAHFRREHGVTISITEYNRLYDEHVKGVYEELARLLPGVQDLLAELQQEGVPTAIASSSRRRWVECVLERFSLTNQFTSVISRDDFEGPSKPDPLIYQRAAKSLSLQPFECVAIEDSEAGVSAAKRAGMACIGLSNKEYNHGLDLRTADLVVNSMGGVRDALASYGLLPRTRAATREPGEERLKRRSAQEEEEDGKGGRGGRW